MKVILLEDSSVSYTFSITEMNLKRSRKHAPHSKFFFGKFGGTSALTFNLDSKLAIDNDNSVNSRNSNTNTLIRQSVTDMDAGTGNTNRDLHIKWIN